MVWVHFKGVTPQVFGLARSAGAVMDVREGHYRGYMQRRINEQPLEGQSGVVGPAEVVQGEGVQVARSGVSRIVIQGATQLRFGFGPPALQAKGLPGLDRQSGVFRPMSTGICNGGEGVVRTALKDERASQFGMGGGRLRVDSEGPAGSSHR